MWTEYLSFRFVLFTERRRKGVQMETNTTSPLSEYLTRDELARELRRSTRTLDRWHTMRVGPPRTRAGKLILYRKSHVVRWLERQTEQSDAA